MPFTHATRITYLLEELNVRLGTWGADIRFPRRETLRAAELDLTDWVRWWNTLPDEHKRIYGGSTWDRPLARVRIVKVTEMVRSERIVIHPPAR